MKKILAIFEGTKYSDNTSKYAIDMAKRTGSMLVGVFIYDTRFTDYAYTYTFDQPFIGMADIERAHIEDFEKIDLNIKLFNIWIKGFLYMRWLGKVHLPILL